MTGKQRHPGLDNRARDKDGEIRHKNGNTRVDTLRGVYGDGFAPHVRGAPRHASGPYRGEFAQRLPQE
jgi:hypothetical protein